MNIGFYGTTAAVSCAASFINIIKHECDANIINTGVLCGSEERILYQVKRARHVDVAVIFHSTWNSIFLPTEDHDILLNDLGVNMDEEMLRNRFYSTIMHIDSYLASKQIFTIHVANPKHIPKWFRFSSGRNHGAVLSIMQEQYREDMPNMISDAGNRQIAAKLVQAIQEHVNTNDLCKSVKTKCSKPSNNNPSNFLINGA